MPPVPTAESEANEQLARLAKAIAHPTRVAILRLLVREEGCIVGDIVDRLPLAQSTVSQHLKQLKAAGLIRGEWCRSGARGHQQCLNLLSTGQMLPISETRGDILSVEEEQGTLPCI